MTRACDIGVIGLGVMGRNLLLNMADHGWAVAGYDVDRAKADALKEISAGKAIEIADSLETFSAALKKPRLILLLVPSGPPVDQVISDLIPFLHDDDCIADGGNSYYKDTDLRTRVLTSKGIHFMGIGISGGEHGARRGPSIMPGGPLAAYARIRPILESIAAKVNEKPCVSYLGPGSAGHYVKMVHNGIEYGMLQLIAETYDLMKRGCGLTDDELRRVYTEWNMGEFGGFLIQITSEIFGVRDEKTGTWLIDQILDEAKQKGTGKWASQDALDLQVPLPVVDAAVASRHLSIYKQDRQAASLSLTGPLRRYPGDRRHLITKIRDACNAALVITFAQCFHLLKIASQTYAYLLELSEIARIWQGGCIIRTGLLSKIERVLKARPDLPNLLLDSSLADIVVSRQFALRSIAATAATLGIPVPAYMAALSYFDGFRSEWLPANLIQAQRDYFGAHSYERTDQKGVFHAQWEK